MSAVRHSDRLDMGVYAPERLGELECYYVYDSVGNFVGAFEVPDPTSDNEGYVRAKRKLELMSIQGYECVECL